MIINIKYIYRESSECVCLCKKLHAKLGNQTHKTAFFQPHTQPQFLTKHSLLILNRRKNAFFKTAFFQPQSQQQPQYQTDP